MNLGTTNVLGELRKFGPAGDFLSFSLGSFGRYNPITMVPHIGNHSRAMYINLTGLITMSRFITKN